MEKSLGIKERYLSFIKAQKTKTGKQVTIAIILNITMIIVVYYVTV